VHNLPSVLEATNVKIDAFEQEAMFQNLKRPNCQ
jgi:hypothetical protein